MPGIPDNDRTASASDTPAAAASAHEPAGFAPSMTKQQAADAVKTLLKPLYVAKALSRDQFKAVAKTCTHALAGTSALAGAGDGVREVVGNCLRDMGVGNILAQL